MRKQHGVLCVLTKSLWLSLKETQKILYLILMLLPGRKILLRQYLHVGHMLPEISRFVYMFMKREGSMKAQVVETALYRSPMLPVALESKLVATFSNEEELDTIQLVSVT